MLSNDDAFRILAATVQEFRFRNRPCLGATLKPALCAAGDFGDVFLRFGKFGSFLQAAAAAGYVQLQQTSPGGDISVSLATAQGESLPTQPRTVPAQWTSLQPPRSTTPSTAPVRVRQDLWNAFNSFSTKWFYDRSADRAFKDPSGARSMPGAENPNLVPIPNGRERVVEWMRSFAGMQDPETGRQLLAALNGESATYQFNTLVRSRDLLRSWSHFHIQQVLAAIDAWAASTGVRPNDITAPLYLPTRPTLLSCAPRPASNLMMTPPVAQTLPGRETSVADTALASPPVVSLLTKRLEMRVDSLIDDLIQLRGLLQVVGSKQS